MIDWDAPALPDDVHATLRAVGVATVTTESVAGEQEGAEAVDAVATSPGERLNLLDAALTNSSGDEDLAAEVRRGASEGLKRAAQGDQDLTMRQVIGLEAVIEIDGSAPSLTVQGGFVDVKAPEVGNWRFALSQFEGLIRDVVAYVGRLNVPISPGFAGTVFAITPDLVVTNRHVLEMIARPDDAGGWALVWPGATTIDFTAEFGKPSRVDYEIDHVVFCGPHPINGTVTFPHLDVAILRMRPVGRPAPVGIVTLEQDPAALYHAQGIYAVGFPAPSMKWFGPGVPPPRFETADILDRVFDRKLGVKKLAPGRIKQLPGTMAGDDRHWVLAYGCSTLAGNSGSALVDLDDNGGRVIGIHFAGVSRARNYGHGFAAIQDIMAAQGASYARRPQP